MILVPTCPYFPSYTHTSATSYLRHAHSINKSNNTPVSQKNIPVSRVSLPVSHVSLPVSLPIRTSRSRFAVFFFFLIGVQTKNTIRKELRFVVWWFTARTLPCNDIPEPKRRNISAKRELRLPFRMGTLSVSQRYRSNPPFRRVVTPGRAAPTTKSARRARPVTRPRCQI